MYFSTYMVWYYTVHILYTSHSYDDLRKDDIHERTYTLEIIICLETSYRLWAELDSEGVERVEHAGQHDLLIGGDLGPTKLQVHRIVLLVPQELPHKNMKIQNQDLVK
jgi:hypothetical protein